MYKKSTYLSATAKTDVNADATANTSITYPKTFFPRFFIFFFFLLIYIHLYLIILELWYIFNLFLIYLSGDNEMNKKINSGLAIILPNKRVNLFVLFIIILGVISGCIFLLALNENDKELVITQISNFLTNVGNNDINNLIAFKNVIIENLIFVLLVWIFGMSILGVVFNIFAVYLKGFITGFTLSAFFLVYKYKGLLAGAIYLIPSGIINILISLILGVYSIMITIYLWKMIFFKDKTNNTFKFLKRYVLILCVCLLFVLVSAVCESYLVPALLKLFIKVFI